MEWLIFLAQLLTLYYAVKLNRKALIQMASQKELATTLEAIKAQLSKASAEIVAKIKELTDAVAAAGATTPEVDAAAADLKTLAQGLDDVVADAQEPPASPPA